MAKLERSKVVSKIRARLMRHGYPRLQMFFLVCVTGFVGFISSYILLELGVLTIWIRYAIAMVIAYLSFLGLLWVWLHTKASEYSDVPDLSGLLNDSGKREYINTFNAQGGDFGGGSASGSFDSPTLDGPAFPADDIGGNVSIADLVEAEELAIPLVAIIILMALLVLSFWIIYSAPILFSELLVDVFFSLTIYKNLIKHGSTHWIETAIKHTWAPCLCVFLVVVLMGWAMNIYTPDAHTLSEVILNH